MLGGIRQIGGGSLFQHAGDGGVVLPLVVALPGAGCVLHYHIVHVVVLEQGLRALQRRTSSTASVMHVI